MHLKLFPIAMIAVASLAACTTRPVVVNTPGPGATVVQVPVPANGNMLQTDDVKENLAKGMGTDASGIDVKVDGTTVYLTGHVATSALREKAHEIAHGTPGVVNVVYDGLTVQ
ncbi:MAG: BON domain-containing protein [Luteimonas sp.]